MTILDSHHPSSPCSSTVTQPSSLKSVGSSVYLEHEPSPHSLPEAKAPPYAPITLSALWEKERLTQAVEDLLCQLSLLSSPCPPLDLRRLSGAMTNAVYHVRLLNVLPPHPGFILRVYGSNADLIISRVREMLWLERLSASGVGSTMLGTFENGRVEAYLPSHTLTDIDIRIPETSRTIAREMRRLHDLISLYPPGLTDREGGERALEWRRCVDAWLPEVIKVIHSSHSSGFLSQQQVDLLDLPSLSPLISQYRAIAHNHPSGTVVSHNDVQYGNILRLDKDHSIVLVDFEYAGYNPKTYDIANHFNEWTADYYGPTPHLLNEAKYPSREERLNFLLAYTQGNSQEALLLEDLIPIWRTASHLFWGLWGLLQTGRDDVADFDYFAYGLGRIQQFRFAVRSLLEKDGLNDSGE